MAFTKITTDNLLADSNSLKLISSFDVSSGSSIEFLNVFDTTADLYILDFNEIKVSVDQAALRFQLGNAPSTWLNSGWFRIGETYSDSFGYGGATTTNQGYINCGGNIRSAGMGYASQLIIANPFSTTRIQSVIAEHGGDASSAGNYQQVRESIYRASGTSYDSFRVIMDSGSITSAVGSLYKLLK